MSIILLILVLILIKDSQFTNDEFDYLSKSTTDGVRGLFVILVFMTHYVTYIQTGDYDSIYLVLRAHLNQAVVVPFLFYSGYGMYIQYEKHGISYLKRIALQKIPSISIRMTIAVCCFLVVRTFQGNYYSPKKLLLTFLAWDSIGNSNWYVFGIVGEYIIFIISYGIVAKEVFHEDKLTRIISAAFSVYLTLAFVKWLQYMGRPVYCYNTLLMFPIGICWANLRKKQILKYKWALLLLALILYNITFQNRFVSLLWYTLWITAFMLICMLLSTKIKIGGYLIRFCATHVFSIYMLQRLPMIILNHVGWTYSFPYISFAICALATGLIAFIFDEIISAIYMKCFSQFE